MEGLKYNFSLQLRLNELPESPGGRKHLDRKWSWVLNKNFCVTFVLPGFRG